MNPISRQFGFWSFDCLPKRAFFFFLQKKDKAKSLVVSGKRQSKIQLAGMLIITINTF